MSIETDCPGCSRRLRVSDGAAGEKARCPVCNTIYSIPGEPSLPVSSPTEHVGTERWTMRTPEGRTYGPVSKPELDGWVAEGRVTADCQLSDGEGQAWQRAERVYPILQTTVASLREPHIPPRSAAAAWTSSQNPIPRRVEPHRGAVILALGIMSWMSCPLFGIFAWSMGTADLHKMQIGRMDRDGRSLTQAGQILGMVHVVLAIIIVTLLVFFMLMMAVAS